MPAIFSFSLIFAGFCALLSLLTGVMARWLLHESGPLHLLKRNYEGLELPNLGPALWMAALAGYGVIAMFTGECAWRAFAAVAFCAGGLGLIDDRFGDHTVGGFRGHFGLLLKGHLTTGAAKALFIPPAAMVVANTVLHQGFVRALLTASLVSMLANSVNMLDMRPGRAAAGWLVGAGGMAVLAASDTGGLAPLMLMVGPVVVYLPFDLSLRAMMGDTGANLLGAVWGLQVALWAPLPLQALLVLCLLGLQVYGELHHLKTELPPWIRWLDRLTGRG